MHIVWGTKYRTPFLDKSLSRLLYEHIHCFVRLRYDRNISSVVKLLKRESSSWINCQGLTKEYFR